jgi:hypothetical protein
LVISSETCLSLRAVLVLGGLLGVGGWSFEVLQVPRHHGEHDRDPRLPLDGGYPKRLIPPKPT